MKERGFYFIGDLTYSLNIFLLTPFDRARHGDVKDNYTFFHFSERISVELECAFGEIDLRWEILWRPLQFRMQNNIEVIDACMGLHNFIADFWEEHTPSRTGISDRDKNICNEDYRMFMAGQSCLSAVLGDQKVKIYDLHNVRTLARGIARKSTIGLVYHHTKS